MLGNVCETKLAANVFHEAHEWGWGGGLGLERGEYARKCIQSDSTYAYTLLCVYLTHMATLLYKLVLSQNSSQITSSSMRIAQSSSWSHKVLVRSHNVQYRWPTQWGIDHRWSYHANIKLWLIFRVAKIAPCFKNSLTSGPLSADSNGFRRFPAKSIEIHTEGARSERIFKPCRFP